MSPNATLDRASSIRDVVYGRPRISVTDLARNKEWRETLPQSGIIEVTDRGETAAWLLSDDDMKALVDGYHYLERELERAQIEAMFAVRSDSRPKTGGALAEAALATFDARKDELAAMIDGD